MLIEPRPDQFVWFDGAFLPWSQALMHVSTHHYGFGVFEGTRAYATASGGAVFRLREHTGRLFRSARILNLPLADRFAEELLNEVQLELLRKNRLRDAYLRPFAFCGGTLGLSPQVSDLALHLVVLAVGWDEAGVHGRSEADARGVSLRTSSFIRPSPSSVLAKAKANANYMTSMLASREARDAGADDALLLDHQGFVSETSSANVFAVHGGTLVTPPLQSVLEGVTRATVLDLAEGAALRAVERPLCRDELYVADEVFLTGTATELTPVREIDGRRIGGGKRGPVTARLQDMYAALVRGRAGREDWLTRF
jgi:branched-chain amino acid aminotransferase